MLTSPGQPLGAQPGVRSRGSNQQGAGNALLLPGKAKGFAPFPGAVGVFRVDEMHAHAPPRQTHDGSCYASDPKALRDPPV